MEESPKGLRGSAISRVQDRLGPWVDERAAETSSRQISDIFDPLNEVLGNSFDAVVDALRFLAARVESLERDVERMRHPIPIESALDKPCDLKKWSQPVCGWLLEHRPDGLVVQAHCGAGELLNAIEGLGLDVQGVEARADFAWKASVAGIRVHIGSLEEILADESRSSLGAVVLSEAFNSRPVGDLVALVDSIGDHLVDAGSIVVLARMPNSPTRGWDTVVSDLSPGRFFHPETWEFILHRAGFSDITRLLVDESGASGSEVDMFGVAGVRTRS